MTQHQLALITGIDRSVISRIESGCVSATFDTVLLMADGLDMTPSELLDGINISPFFPGGESPIML